MKETYVRPMVTNAGARDNSNEIFPAVAALEAGYAAGKAVKSVFSGDFEPAGSLGLVKRKEFKD